jgi:hypothetical protein
MTSELAKVLYKFWLNNDYGGHPPTIKEFKDDVSPLTSGYDCEEASKLVEEYTEIVNAHPTIDT